MNSPELVEDLIDERDSSPAKDAELSQLLVVSRDAGATEYASV